MRRQLRLKAEAGVGRTVTATWGWEERGPRAFSGVQLAAVSLRRLKRMWGFRQVPLPSIHPCVLSVKLGREEDAFEVATGRALRGKQVVTADGEGWRLGELYDNLGLVFSLFLSPFGSPEGQTSNM